MTVYRAVSHDKQWQFEKTAPVGGGPMGQKCRRTVWWEVLRGMVLMKVLKVIDSRGNADLPVVLFDANHLSLAAQRERLPGQRVSEVQ